MSFYSVQRVINAINSTIQEISADAKQALFIPITSKLRKDFPKMHYHEFPELFLQLQTDDLFVFPDEEKVIKPKQACLIPRGLPHKEIVKQAKHKFENIVIHYNKQGVVIHFAQVKPENTHPSIRDLRIFYTEESFRIFQYFNDAIEFSHLGYSNEHSLVKLPILTALHMILHIIEKPFVKESSAHHKIKLCKSFILLQIHDPNLNIKSLASRVGASADYLSRLFQKEVGCSLHYYIYQQRVLMARELLLKSDLDIKQISVQCGFSDASYFTKVFKKAVKKSPKDYRKKQTDN